MTDEQQVRRAGRPPKQTIGAGIKKGKPVWKPASAMEVINKEPGYRYRWANKTADNLSKKELEGWETVNGLQADGSRHMDSGRIDDGKPMTSISERHDCLLMRMPEELGEARDEYMRHKTEQRTRALTAHLKEAAREEGTAMHGEITISSRKGVQTIE